VTSFIDKFLAKRVQIPEDRRYYPEQGLWAKSDEKWIIVGLTEPALVLAGGLTNLEWLVTEGQSIEQGGFWNTKIEMLGTEDGHEFVLF
jgi:glycine cleavage system H lipoate-binding protein